MAVTGAFIVPHPPIIFPEVGRGEEKKIQKTIDAYREVARRIAALKPETVVISSPHSVMYGDYFHISPGNGAKGDFRKFGAPEVSVSVDYDSEFVDTLHALAKAEGFPAGTMGEREPELDHATLIPLRFIQEKYTDFKAVRIGLSGLGAVEHYELGKLVARAAGKLGRRVVYVASGDLSHKLKDDGPYGFSPDGPVFDSEVTEAMETGDFMRFLTFDEPFCESAAECGLRSFQMMAGALDGEAVSSELLSYEGPFGVGYGVASFRPIGDDSGRHFDVEYRSAEAQKLVETKAGEDPYVRLARYSLETFVKTGAAAQLPSGLPEDMLNRRAGVFVSLKEFGRLRGCIGTISPVTGSVAEEILRNAVSACSEDPRFDPVTKDELPELVYSVDVLGEPERINSKAVLDPVKYGVIVSNGGRRGLLLPNLEGVETVDQQIDIARQKAGIGRGEPLELHRFEVVRHK